METLTFLLSEDNLGRSERLSERHFEAAQGALAKNRKCF
jgi:hypothetical protein